jgi:uncharacterized repeat protein (TIGR03803 family)
VGGNISCYSARGENCGTVFEMSPSGAETVLYAFNGPPLDGAEPYGNLIMDANGNLYGTTAYGGNTSACGPGIDGGGYGCGTVFMVTPSGQERVLYAFGTNPNDGFTPQAGLVMDASGNLYGTTAHGGQLFGAYCKGQFTVGCGTVFKVTPSGQESVLYTFCPSEGKCPDGANPLGGVVFGPDGNLYGTTLYGGVYDCTGSPCGTVFKLSLDGSETVVHAFTGGSGDGGWPLAGVIFDVSGNLYGTTEIGGKGGGTVFEITAAGQETLLYSFDGEDGQYNPSAGLIFDGQGNLYGTTAASGSEGGSGRTGTVFEVTPSGQETVLYTFSGLVAGNNDGPDGSTPMAGLIFDQSGNLYGTAEFGGTGPGSACIYGLGCGVVFELTQQVGSFTHSPTVLNFGLQAVGTTTTQILTATNGGPDAMVISSVTAAAPYSSVSANGCTAPLGVGQSCQVSVAYSPQSPGQDNGSVIFVDNAPGSPQSISLSAQAVISATIEPASFTFGKQLVGTTSSPKTFTLSNNLSTTLTGITLSITGDFAISSTNCGTTLAGNASCTINVTFTPLQSGHTKGQLRVSDGANNSPQTATLVGIGAEPGCPVNGPSSCLAGCGKTRLEADAVPRNSLVSTAQPDKKEVCAEKTNSSWMSSAMLARSSECRTTILCVRCAP